MGMFDRLKCLYPLPLEGANALDYQTKDTPAQFLDQYEIRDDGTLWHEEYDTEDQSEAGRWQKEHPGEELPKSMGLLSLMGCMTKINGRWIQEAGITGEIRFYTSLGKDHSGWIEWSAYFVNGKLNQIHLITNTPPK